MNAAKRFLGHNSKIYDYNHRYEHIGTIVIKNINCGCIDENMLLFMVSNDVQFWLGGAMIANELLRTMVILYSPGKVAFKKDFHNFFHGGHDVDSYECD